MHNQEKLFGKVFSNFNYDMSPAEGEDSFKEFELKRAYLGYSYKIDDKFSTKITFDVGNNTGGTAYTAFLKIAQLNWKYNDNVSINFGMIGTKNFKFMEKAWEKDTSINLYKIKISGPTQQTWVLHWTTH